MESKNRKIRGKLEDQIEEEMELALKSVPKPSVSKLWPVRLVVGSIWLARNTPAIIRHILEERKRREEIRKLQEEKEKESEEEVNEGSFLS